MKSPQEMVLELNSLGIDDPEIATRCDTSQPTIWRIKKSKQSDTSYRIGKAIENLYGQVVNSNSSQSDEGCTAQTGSH